MTEPNAKLLADESMARITLAGVEWPVPKLAIKQNAQIFPLVMAYLKNPQAALSTFEGIQGLSTMAFVALQRAHESLTRAEFDNMTITVDELVGAFQVVIAQSGLRTKEKANGVPGPLAGTAETPSPPTGSA
ncbi:MAG TPA: hypothetical protein VN894_11300 [Polyangiaceae bacterium]|nr:hypothetical protein [Polyangiaceae bacterium]